MGVESYSTTPANNTAIGGVNIDEGCSPAGVNNAIRQIMADIAEWRDAGGGGGAGGQPLDATLTGLAALENAADDMIYATGTDAFAATPSTSFGRSLLAAASGTAAQTLIGGGGTVSGTGGTSWEIALGGGIVLTGRAITIPGNATTAFAYGNGHTYASWANAWLAADDSNNDVSCALISNGLTTGTVYSNASGTVSGQLFAIGI